MLLAVVRVSHRRARRAGAVDLAARGQSSSGVALMAKRRGRVTCYVPDCTCARPRRRRKLVAKDITPQLVAFNPGSGVLITLLARRIR